MQFDMHPRTRLTPGLLMTRLRDDIRALKETVANLRFEMRDFQDPKRLKAWLKEYRVPPEPRLDEWMDFPFDDFESSFEFR